MRFFGLRTGIVLSRVAILLLLVSTANSVSLHACDTLLWTCAGNVNRARIKKQLENSPGKHLIIVRYNEGHNIHEEWVFNGADLDEAKVLWARELDEEQNTKLLNYYKDRTVWLAQPDEDPSVIVPYAPLDSR